MYSLTLRVRVMLP